MIDKETGREIRDDSTYSLVGVWQLHKVEDAECVELTLTYMSSPAASQPEGKLIGEFYGNGLDARRWMNEKLGYEPYQPMESEFL